MTENFWTRWPSREALGREAITRPRRLLAWGSAAAGARRAAVGRPPRQPRPRGAGVAGAGRAARGRVARVGPLPDHARAPAVALSGALLLAAAARWPPAPRPSDSRSPALVLCCGCAVSALERLPLAAAVPVAVGRVSPPSPSSTTTGGWPSATVVGGMALAGYALRLDAEARGNAQRLLAQERAARAAEAESAALAERARIAREIHDVLAHSLSAQLVHLEAARLLIERGADRDQILERVVAARGHGPRRSRGDPAGALRAAR